MSLCDFSAFLRLPFSTSYFLHYLLKYAFEIYEAKMLNTELQKILEAYNNKLIELKY